MESSKSIFRDLNYRELSGFRVRKRPLFDDYSLSFYETGSFAVSCNGELTPPLAISFCKTIKNAHILALSDEDGYLSLFNTRTKLSPHDCKHQNADKARVSVWEAHNNALFDICWMKDGTQILTASGDQTVKLWDVEDKKCVNVMMSHTGSVKSICCHPTGRDILVSGARDGSFAIWDLRCRPASRTSDGYLCMDPVVAVKGAHNLPQTKSIRSGKAASVSITSVMYLKDEFSIATAGAADSTIKFWDTRNLKNMVTAACPHSVTSGKKRSHGISSLSQDSNGVYLSASCTDNRIYLYNILQLDKGPIKYFSGCQIDSFFVKAVISPDAAHILSGSGDGNAYVWQVDKSQENPLVLTGHEEEVTSVDWCVDEMGKLATSSDDLTIRTWNMKINECSSSRSSSSLRKRVMAISSEEGKINAAMDLISRSDRWRLSDKPKPTIESSNLISIPDISTPKGQKKSLSSSVEEICQTTPLNASNSPLSPGSILSPPPSVKRKTIRDYFVAASL